MYPLGRGMSLKIFHLIFITFADITVFGFAFWALRYSNSQNNYFYYAVGSFILGILIVFYEIKFFKKFKNIDS